MYFAGLHSLESPVGVQARLVVPVGGTNLGRIWEPELSLESAGTDLRQMFITSRLHEFFHDCGDAHSLGWCTC